jgi:diguanylate cyclase (GGDEF)-like protein
MSAAEKAPATWSPSRSQSDRDPKRKRRKSTTAGRRAAAQGALAWNQSTLEVRRRGLERAHRREHPRRRACARCRLGGEKRRAPLERYLVEALGKEILRAGRHGRPLALLMVAVDELGTPDGSTGVPNARDHVLRQVAGRLRRWVPRDGTLARYGAEQFVIALPEHTLETARAIAERVREGAGDSSPAVGPRVTVSIGGAQ